MMMKRATLLLAVLALAACQSTKTIDTTDDIVPPPAPVSSPTTDAKLNELQTSLTELLERLDVLNDRIARVESAAESRSVATSAPAPQPSAPQPSAREVAISPAPQPMPAPVATQQQGTVSDALVAAKINDDYRAALELYGRSKMAEARRAFQQVFDADPSGQLADNALYWIGETYFAAKNYPEAMKMYQRVVKEYPTENKAPDAMFKVALMHEKSGDLAMAKQAFEECIRRYPYSTPAASAKLELKRIKY